MPAESASQQRLMGWVHAYQTGRAKKAPKKIRDIAATISEQDAKDFAETSHADLPEKKAMKNVELLRRSVLLSALGASAGVPADVTHLPPVRT